MSEPKSLTRDEWIDALERNIALNMPDMYPSGYARATAERRAVEGGYDAYIRGDFADGNLWEPPRTVTHPEVTRVEIIESGQRAFVGYFDSPGADVHVQDDGRTIKIFLEGERR